MTIAQGDTPTGSRGDNTTYFEEHDAVACHSAARTKQEDIQAVILAAGRGSRLGDANGHQPKCLAAVSGRRLIDHQLDVISALGIRQVCVVTGYKAEAVRAAVGGRARFLHNPRWASTNSLYSLSLCRDWVRNDMLVLNCDVLAHPDVLTRLIGEGRSAFAYDSSSGQDCEHMKVELCGGLLTAMNKSLPGGRTFGENVGILYFSRMAAQLLFAEARELIRSGGAGLWLASAVERVGRLLPLRGVDIGDLPWIEIDFPEDLKCARQQAWGCAEAYAA